MLDGQAPELRPVVRVIDDWFKNRRYGLVIEATVGKGKLLISAIDISQALPEQTVLNQFRKSILGYMNSAAFNPTAELDESKLSMMIVKPRPPKAAKSKKSNRGNRGKPAKQ